MLGRNEFAPGAIEALRLLRHAGFALVLSMNQSGNARGYFNLATQAAVARALFA
jgi:D-glycero-D-manno-heptose 1,7-bisphosphate phosphatase